MMGMYKCVRICKTAEETEQLLNEFADEGYRVVCDYSLSGNYLILEKKE